MVKKFSSIAKITKPNLSHVLPRERLFSLLDEGRRSPVTWVSGPGGSGKTTLIASWLDAKKFPCLWYHLDEDDNDIATFFYYLGLAAKKAAPRYKKALPLLTPEYLRGIPTFTRRFFEELCSRLKPSSVIVFDNYHHIAPESPFHDVVREALAAVPEGITVIINSRGVTPQSLAMLSTYNKIYSIGWDDLKFERSETGSLMRMLQKEALSEQVLTQVHTVTTGWAAGLVLLTDRLRCGAIAPRELDQLKPQEFFDYFATELFAKTDPDTQDFLLKTSFLPHISTRAAVELTGKENAGAILTSLSRNNFFTEQRSTADPVYRYHPLFREFLDSRAREAFSAEEVRAIRLHAAALLEESGQDEDAAELYRLSGDWQGFIRLVLANAMTIVSQGRSRSLETWLKCIPENILDREPWLLYWMGVCRMPFALLEGRTYFERAFTIFKKKHDVSGLFLSWSGVVESIIQELGDLSQMDPWIALLDELTKEHPVFPSPQVEGHVTCRIFMSLSLRQPWHPAFDRWKEKALELLNSGADANLRLLMGFYLLTHFIQAGDQPMCEQVTDTIRRLTNTSKDVSPLAYTMGKMADAWLAWATCDYEHCLTTMNEGLEKSRDTGVHLWDNLLLMIGVLAADNSGDPRLAEDLLRKMATGLERGRPLEKYYYYVLAGWHCMLRGDLQGAMSLSTTALELATKIGFLGAEVRSRLSQAHYLRVARKYRQAKERIVQSLEIAQKLKSPLITFYCRLKAADIAFAEGEEKTAFRSLLDAMTLGREKSYAAFNYAYWLPEEMSFLCMKALEAGIEPDFVVEMIRKRNLVPESPPLHIERWPWPIKIYTLGRFETEKDGRQLQFSGKVQKKPLELLKAIIAFGGLGVREDMVIDALWPDAEGDAARISFKTTLHRLRQLLGKDEFIQLQDNRISLDRRYCWVDAWAFEKILNDAETGRTGDREKGLRKTELARQKPALNPALLEKAIKMYQGHFLSEEEGKPWSASFRERLRSKYLRAVNTLGDYWQEQWKASRNERAKLSMEKAIECYQRGLEIDDVAEEFYQNLMLCNHKIGRKAEAVKVYKRCKNALAAAFGIGPSEETEGIYKTIVGQ